MVKKSNNLTGVTGEYYVCAELGKIGILALPTPKNNPLFDIIAIAPDASRTVTIQVKTMSEINNQGWKFGKDVCERQNNPSFYTVLVNLKSKEIDYYIYQYDYLSERVENAYTYYMEKPKKDGDKHKDIAFRWFDLRQFTQEDFSRKNKWDLLGFDLKSS